MAHETDKNYDWAKRTPEQQRLYDEMIDASRQSANLSSDGVVTYLTTPETPTGRRNRIAEIMAAAFISNPNLPNLTPMTDIAAQAAQMADALIAELDK